MYERYMIVYLNSKETRKQKRPHFGLLSLDVYFGIIAYKYAVFFEDWSYTLPSTADMLFVIAASIICIIFLCISHHMKAFGVDRLCCLCIHPKLSTRKTTLQVSYWVFFQMTKQTKYQTILITVENFEENKWTLLMSSFFQNPNIST